MEVTGIIVEKVVGVLEPGGGFDLKVKLVGQHDKCKFISKGWE